VSPTLECDFHRYWFVSDRIHEIIKSRMIRYVGNMHMYTKWGIHTKGWVRNFRIRDAGVSWRTVLKVSLERWGLNVAIELKWHALWNRSIKASLLVDDDGGGDDYALWINREILVPWIQQRSWRLLCSGKWHYCLRYLVTSVSEKSAACFFRVEDKGRKCLQIQFNLFCVRQIQEGFLIHRIQNMSISIHHYTYKRNHKLA
jgi:hypothetical protein